MSFTLTSVTGLTLFARLLRLSGTCESAIYVNKIRGRCKCENPLSAIYVNKIRNSGVGPLQVLERIAERRSNWPIDRSNNAISTLKWGNE